MNETDIPCSDCGAELVERTVHVRELPVSTNWQGHVQIAECPACAARYYPKQALSQLSRTGNNSPPRGG